MGVSKFAKYKTWYFMLKETIFPFAKLPLINSFYRSLTNNRKNYLSDTILFVLA